jgi:hypothetical protein
VRHRLGSAPPACRCNQPNRRYDVAHNVTVTTLPDSHPRRPRG